VTGTGALGQELPAPSLTRNSQDERREKGGGMGTHTGLWLGKDEYAFGHKLEMSEEGAEHCAPLLWHALFEPDDVFIEKSWDGDCYAVAQTTARRALDRLATLDAATKDDPYLQGLLSPLVFLRAILNSLPGWMQVGFDLMEFGSFGGEWDPEGAMGFAENILWYVCAFDMLARGGACKKKAMQVLAGSSLVFKGSFKQDRRAFATSDEDGPSPLVRAMWYLVAGPYDSALAEMFMRWARSRRWMWEGGEPDAELMVQADASLRFRPLRGKKPKPHRDGVFQNEDSCVTWRNGKRNGPAKYWDTGEIRCITRYKNDRLHGVERFYMPPGTLYSICRFERGRVVEVLESGRDEHDRARYGRRGLPQWYMPRKSR